MILTRIGVLLDHQRGHALLGMVAKVLVDVDESKYDQYGANEHHHERYIRVKKQVDPDPYFGVEKVVVVRRRRVAFKRVDVGWNR